MSTVAEIEAAIAKLPRERQQEVADWLMVQLIDESPTLLAAIDEADRSMVEEGGVPVEEVRRNLRRWITK